MGSFRKRPSSRALEGWLLAALAGLVLGGCDGKTVPLGAGRPPPYRFGTPRLVAELDTRYANENPTLTADLLDLTFNSGRGDTRSDVWTAHRDGAQGPFGPPARVAEVSTAAAEMSPAISFDGLSLYFGSDRGLGPGDLDIWRAVRPDRSAPWSPPEPLATLSSPARDIPRPPGLGDLVMPLASERARPGQYQTYLAARPSPDQPFGTPVLIAELTAAGHLTGDAFLSDDGLTLFYSFAPVGGKLDLFVAWRRTTSDRFEVALPLDDLNTGADERDPWLSPDGATFFFASDRSGLLQIYEVAASRAGDAGI